MRRSNWRILVGDCREHLATLPERSVQTVITSPPYFGLRDYGHDGQIGLEPTPDEFVAALVEVFRAVRWVLRDDGTVWLNLGDSYNAYNGNRGPAAGLNAVADVQRNAPERGLTFAGCKPKDLLGIPWMVAFALRADGWYLRSDIIWAKPNPMPESVTDRPTKAHEYLFLLSKGPRYFYDADAIRESDTGGTAYPSAKREQNNGAILGRATDQHGGLREIWEAGQGRNKRSVWTVATQPFPGAHFATFPPKLIEPCILAGTSPKACGECGAPWRRVVERTSEATQPGNGKAGMDGWSRNDMGNGRAGMFESSARTLGWEPSCAHHDDSGACVVLDPFAGSGTVGVACGWHGRDFIGCELNPDYAQMARERIALEGRPGGTPNGHEPARLLDGQLGLEIT